MAGRSAGRPGQGKKSGVFGPKRPIEGVDSPLGIATISGPRLDESSDAAAAAGWAVGSPESLDSGVRSVRSLTSHAAETMSRPAAVPAFIPAVRPWPKARHTPRAHRDPDVGMSPLLKRKPGSEDAARQRVPTRSLSGCLGFVSLRVPPGLCLGESRGAGPGSSSQQLGRRGASTTHGDGERHRRHMPAARCGGDGIGSMWPSLKGHTVDVLASRGDEGRGNLR